MSTTISEPTNIQASQNQAPVTQGTTSHHATTTEEPHINHVENQSHNDKNKSFMDKLRNKAGLGDKKSTSEVQKQKEDLTIPDPEPPAKVAAEGAVSDARVPEDLAQTVAKTTIPAAPITL